MRDHPYFSIAKSVAARAAKELNDDQKGQLIASAAIFATDRKHLKKYVNGDLAFLKEQPKQDVAVVTEKPKAKEPQEEPKAPAPTSTPAPKENIKGPSGQEVDQILDEHSA